MSRYWKLAGSLLGALLALFLLFQLLEIPFLVDPGDTLERGGLSAAAVGVGLLVADVFIPVPSSLLMVAHGKLFGVWVGTLLSIVGTVGAALLGFLVGRAGGPLVERLVTPAEKARADRLLDRWGALAIVVTRPIPLLAETVAILSGASPLRWPRVAAAAAAGAVVPALLYALTGAYAASFGNASLMMGLVLLVTAIFWFVGRRLGTTPNERDG